MDPASERVERRLAAILAADVEGYSRHIGRDDVGAMRMLVERRESAREKIAEHRGRTIDTAGDSILAEFASVVDAVACALEIQKANAAVQRELAQDARMNLRIGIHIGDVVVRGGELFGDGVNTAARLQALAEPGGVCVSGAVWDQVRRRLPVEATALGPQTVKNIAEPVPAFRLRSADAAAAALASALTVADMPAPPLPNKPSIAVLPFQNLSHDPEQEYFADGMVEDIITALSRIRSLFVIARNSTFTYKGRAVDVKQVGRELGVRYVLEGSVRKAGNRVRISGQLIDAETGAHIWGERYDRDLTDIFALQDEVTRNVVAAIEPNLYTIGVARARAKPTESLDAYDFYLRGLSEIAHNTIAGFRQATSNLRQAVERDPNFAEAWAVLSVGLMAMTFGGVVEDTDAGYAEATAAARKAVALDPDNGQALAVAARTIATSGSNLDEAVELANRALHLHPNSTVVHTQGGWVFVFNGESERALEHFELARRMNPLDPWWQQTVCGMAAAHMAARRFEEAMAATKRVLDSRPDDPIALRFRAISLAHLGRVEEARAAAAHAMKVHPNFRMARVRWSFRDLARKQIFFDGARLAGLPE